LITCVFDPGSTAVILVLEWGVTFCGVYLLLTIPAPRKGQKLMVTPSLPQESPDFSSARRTLHQLVRRAHLSGPTLEQMDRRAIAALVTSLPLAVLSLILNAPAGAQLTFLRRTPALERLQYICVRR
jgi:hypothetical protein